MTSIFPGVPISSLLVETLRTQEDSSHANSANERELSSPIAGKLPMQVSKAYGVAPQSLQQSPRTAELSNKLIAGQVKGAVNFDASPTQRTSSGVSHVFQMYTRAADKVEAAVAVQIGRSLDVKG